MRLIWHFALIAMALVVGFIPVLLNQESSAGNKASSKALQAEAELLKEERRRADALAQALAAAKLTLRHPRSRGWLCSRSTKGLSA
jgi:hypothetical protein